MSEALCSYKEAEQRLRQLGLERDLSSTLNNLGNAYRTRAELGINPAENLSEAIHSYQEAAQIRRQLGLEYDLSRVLNNLGVAYETRAELGINPVENLSEAINFYREALTIIKPEVSPADCFKLGKNLGNIGWQQENWLLAVEGYHQALQGIEQSRHWATSRKGKQEALTQALNFYERLVISAIKTDQFDIAWQAIERSKSRLLVDLLANADLIPENATEQIKKRLKFLRRQISTLTLRVEPELTTPEVTPPIDFSDSIQRQASSTTDSNLNDLQQQLAQARKALNQLLEELKPENPDFVLTQKVDFLALSQLQSLLSNKTAVVQWYVGFENLIAFVITQTEITPITFVATATETLKSFAVDYFSDYEKDNWAISLSSRLEQLATVLNIIRLLEAIPDQCQELLLVPHRYLHLFPLHALFDSDRFPKGIRYVPSAQLFHHLCERPKKSFTLKPNFFAISNPTENLLNAEFEVNAIQTLFAPHTHILARQQASLSAFNHINTQQKLQTSQIIHFSCHGKFNPSAPLQTSLSLASGVDPSTPHHSTEKHDLSPSPYCKGKRSEALTLEKIFESLNLPYSDSRHLIRLRNGIHRSGSTYR